MRARVFKLTHTESQGCQQELERRLATNTYICAHTHTHRVHSYRTQIKLWQWESEHRLPRQSGEPPTAEQSHKKKKKKDKIDRWNWRKIKMFMALSPSGLYLWLVWLISFSFISLPFLYLLPRSVRLLISQPRHLATPAPDWLLGFLSFSLTLLFRVSLLFFVSFPSVKFDESRLGCGEGEFRYIRWCGFSFFSLFLSCERCTVFRLKAQNCVSCTKPKYVGVFLNKSRKQFRSNQWGIFLGTWDQQKN